MDVKSEDHRLLKFLLASGGFLFIGTMQGMLQVYPPIRAYLDSIGSPYGGPGHMIDPLAHAHVNLVGGVTLMVMAVSYYLFPRITGQSIYSNKLLEHSFYWTCLGVCGFYTSLMIFGVWEGELMLHATLQEMADVHHIYGYVISVVSTVMAIGFAIYFTNLFRSFLKVRRARG